MGNVGAVFVFEWKRALTVPRMAWWTVMTVFPVSMVALIRFTAQKNPPPREFWAGFFFALFPMLVSMLGTLLWATPAISAELERRSWIYLTVRPNGGTAVLLGKYLAAVTWILPAAVVGVSIAVPLSVSNEAWSLWWGGAGDAWGDARLQTAIKEAWTLWWTMIRLVCLSCPAYAAIYLLLGTLMPRRALVLAVAYTLIFELLMGLIPAVINKMTFQYRLRALLFEWCDLPIPGGRESGALAPDRGRAGLATRHHFAAHQRVPFDSRCYNLALQRVSIVERVGRVMRVAARQPRNARNTRKIARDAGCHCWLVQQ